MLWSSYGATVPADVVVVGGKGASIHLIIVWAVMVEGSILASQHIYDLSGHLDSSHSWRGRRIA